MEIGLIAEDRSDAEVLDELTRKIIPKKAYKLRCRLTYGCGAFRKKCQPLAENLLRVGCKHIVLLHDLDTRDEDALRAELADKISELGFSSHVILIPIQEIEAWLLSDGRALREVFSLKKEPKVPHQPQLVSDPKNTIRRIVWKEKKRYNNTTHNPKIAALIDVDSLGKCRSFQAYPDFLRALNG